MVFFVMRLSYDEIKNLVSDDAMISQSPDDLFSMVENIKILINEHMRNLLDSSPNELVDQMLVKLNADIDDTISIIKNDIQHDERDGSMKLNDVIHKMVDILTDLIDKHKKHTMLSQFWYLSRMKALGYEIESEGMCFGLTHMAMQAFLSDDLKTFNERLKKIYEMPLNDFKEDFSELRKKQQQLIIEGRTDDAFVINQSIVDTLAFFDGISLYAQTGKYRDMFSGKVLDQDALKTMQVTLPVSLDTKEKTPAVVSVIHQLYDKKKFMGELTTLQNKLGEDSFSLTLFLFPDMVGSAGHAINLNYDCNAKQWLLIDPNLLPGIESDDLDVLTDAIWSALPGMNSSSHLMIGATLYTTNDHKKTMLKNFNNRYKTPDELLFHSIVDQINSAAKEGDFSSAEMILMKATRSFDKDEVASLKYVLMNKAFESGEVYLIDRLLDNDLQLCERIGSYIDKFIKMLPAAQHVTLVSTLGDTLFSMINDSYDLVKILDSLSENAHPMCIYGLDEKIPSLIPDIDSLIDVLMNLSPEGHAALIASQGEYLCSILTDDLETGSLNRNEKNTVCLFAQELESWRLKQASHSSQDSVVPQKEAPMDPLIKENQLKMKQEFTELKSKKTNDNDSNQDSLNSEPRLSPNV